MNKELVVNARLNSEIQEALNAADKFYTEALNLYAAYVEKNLDRLEEEISESLLLEIRILFEKGDAEEYKALDLLESSDSAWVKTNWYNHNSKTGELYEKVREILLHARVADTSKTKLDFGKDPED